MFVTVDWTGSTKILCVSLLAIEDQESFRWVADCFVDAFRVVPKVLFTDSDPAIEVGFKAAWSSFQFLHFLCIWHISINMKTNLNPACLGVTDLASRLSAMWWRICKLSDKKSIATFESEWKELENVLSAEAKVSKESKAYTAALKWLEKARLVFAAAARADGPMALPQLTAILRPNPCASHYILGVCLAVCMYSRAIMTPPPPRAQMFDSAWQPGGRGGPSR